MYIPVESGSINEHIIYLEHYPTLVEILGTEPLNVVADRGFDIKAVREDAHDARRQIVHRAT